MESWPSENSQDERTLFFVQCRAHSLTVSVALRDITANGCMIDHRSLNLHPGERVLVTPPGLGAIAATVMWIWEGKAGLEFERPLYGPVLAHLLKTGSG